MTTQPEKWCNLCGQPIHGGYHVYQPVAEGPGARGLTVCDACERAAPRCQVCGVPMAGDWDQGPVCARCRVGLPRCSVCGRVLSSTYIQVEGAKGLYCETCFAERERCAACGAPLGSQTWRLPDGRAICESCHATAVLDAARAETLYEQVAHVLAEGLGLRVLVRPPLRLVSAVEMAALTAQGLGSGPLGEGATLGLFVRRGRRRAIYVVYGLPQLLLFKVLAHEYGHAWQSENCPLQRDPLLLEGFCEWAAYKALADQGASKAMADMGARQGFYGRALRRLLDIERQGGVLGVLDEMRKVAPRGVAGRREAVDGYSAP